ncbi:MlaD family protein [Vibrio diazotrophicus]|uniref:Paraquat-inducible protein B n=1 Tax=Vibrio diazotrophicus TaxID=685 RepID=A0A2J8I101_VIBDI|nr:MlaD family protein [Vibrio diazotrophicus]PNH88360.1 paraquat-inducible protein B [Vibrio diazotrophicus]PNI04178.1 paraquat-inducible protein B [Vibrio diazotrophicus]
MNKNITQQTSYKPDVKKNKGISPLWILPILTVVLAGWLIMKSIHDAGERIQIYFSNAQGLVAGRTPVRYQGLEVGMVRNIKLSPNLDSIYVDTDIYPDAKRLLSEKTRFWLVKPTASLSGISGLDALVSGNYIAIDPGDEIVEDNDYDADDHPQSYRALDSAPSDLLANQGLTITLKARDLGGISVGSQIVYKKIPIGEVYNYQLADDNQSVIIDASIQEQYRNVITTESRFWNVSGIGANLGLGGVDIRMESVAALLGGAIAVDSPDEGEPAEQNSQFKLYPDLRTAGRGVAIKIVLPDDNNISVSGAPIMYRGLEIGQITNLQLDEERKEIIASAAIQPAFSDMLNSGSNFILEEAKIALTGVENLGNLIKGNYLTLVPGEGDRSRHFVAVRKQEFNRTQAKSVALKLIADSSFGLSAGTDILYRGVAVGSVTKVSLKPDNVEFDVLIDEEYVPFIGSNSRFYVTGTATAELTESGLNVSIPPAKQLLTGSISFVSEGSKQIQSQYRLYQSQSLAELAKYNQSGTQTFTLMAEELPPVSAGSPLLYRNLRVGNVAGYTLTSKGVEIKVKIENQYKHLITSQTVFWNRSGVEIDASLAGISVKAAPLQTLIQGGIAFDNISGVDNKVNDKWVLYPSYQQAQKYGKTITLTASGDVAVPVGTNIKYQGVSVGEVVSVTPSFTANKIAISARIKPEYSKNIATKGSVFWIASAKVSLTHGIENIENLLSKSIEVKPGDGDPTYSFPLSELPYKKTSISFTLQSEDKGSVSVGTPVLFRGMDVGRVTRVQLGNLADRVISTIEIEPEYSYLIRQNSVFWNVSGVDVSIGLSGADIKAGTFDSIVRGGITFSTPEQKQLMPAAKAGQSFYLYSRAEEGWKQWRTPIPQPN